MFSSSGVRTSDWVHYGIPAAHQVSWRSDGYPSNLDRYPQYGTSEYRISAVAHIGKGGNYVRSGIYICKFDGDGQVDFEKDGTVVSRSNNTMIVNVTSYAGIRVRISRTNASNPVHNITLFPSELMGQPFPEYPFHPEFVAELRGAAILRFSGWLRVDSNDYNSLNQPRDWSKRTTTMNQTQNCLQGVALEHMIALCNILGASPWFGLPKAASASDSYITQFATMVRDNLDPSLSVYIEYRDEGPPA